MPKENSYFVKLSPEQAEEYRALIPVGSDNAVTAAELATRFRMPERRARAVIACLRSNHPAKGEAVLSSENGYWRSQDASEIMRFLRRSESSARHIFRSLREARAALAEQHE